MKRILVSLDQTTDWGRRLYEGAYFRGRRFYNWKILKYQNKPMESLLRYIQEIGPLDGALIHVASSRFDPQLQQLPFPIVNTSNTRRRLPFPSVRNDDVAAGRLAGDYLRERGFKRVYFLRVDTAYSEEREQGLRQVWPELQALPMSAKAQLQAELLHADPGCAWVAADDGAAASFQDWAQEQTIHFPEQGGLLSFNNDRLLCVNRPVPISSVDLDFRAVGERAADCLQQLLLGEDVREMTTQRIQALGVEERESTGALQLDHPSLQKAVEAIQVHQGDLRMEDVLPICGCTRRALELQFKQELGTTPHQFILKTRAERARRLLLESSRTVTDIAITCGFSGPTQIGAVFQKLYGKTPTQIRSS